MKRQIKKVTSSMHSLFNLAQMQKVYRKPPGEIPGTPIHTGIQRLDEVLLTVHDFDEDHYTAVPIKEISTSASYLEDDSKTWIQVQGLHEIDKLKAVWDYFELHPLVQEDIVSTSQRPKIEPYPDIVFIVLRMITPKTESDGSLSLETEQVSIVLGINYVLSFQESDKPVFDPILKRLKLSNTYLRNLGTDYLAYALIDTIVDHYFQALDLIGESIDELDELIISDSKESYLQKIQALRKDLNFFRKSVWSLREGVNNLIRDKSPYITDEVKVYLRDVSDHVVQVIDNIEINREMIYGLIDIYMSGLSNRMNEVMKVLTIIATIFIPLTFVAGIYGMNFDPETSPLNMPELKWYYGYPFAIVLMLVMALSLVA
ncbi:MAG: magnesium/cobalt transporter CorA, partial [Balneolales bacterium]